MLVININSNQQQLKQEENFNYLGFVLRENNLKEKKQ